MIIVLEGLLLQDGCFCEFGWPSKIIYHKLVHLKTSGPVLDTLKSPALQM